jgi:stearoyl-CoA desaturase (delta-9 desaturase)
MRDGTLVAMEAVPAPRRYTYSFKESFPFYLIHLAAASGVVLLGWSWKGFGLAMIFYVVRMFGVTAGYHRYFSHRTYKMGRVMQFLMGWLASSSAQKGVLWWSAHHRRHHKYSDEPQDVHSVKQDGFFHSHVGWIICREYQATDWDRIKDFAKYPELRWLNTNHLVPPFLLGLALYLIGGPFALVWGLLVSTVLLWHGTFTINSLSHMIGRRRYQTTDDSRNNWLLAIVTMGEGWHNNHHYYQRSTRQGFYWWEIDVTYYILTVMSWVGLVRDLQGPPAKVRDHREPVPAPSTIADADASAVEAEAA